MNKHTLISTFSKKIESAQVSLFGTPHFVVDELFSNDLTQIINHMWPTNGFQNEVKGNRIFPIFQNKYKLIEHGNFWSDFNISIWPHLLSAIAKKFEPYGYSIFGDLYRSHISPDHPLTLMEANNDYNGHDMHTHFYHAPHWTFTVLIYIDNLDTISEGTTLHSLNPSNENVTNGLSCNKNELDRCTNVAFDTFRWKDPQKPSITYTNLEIDYKVNRLFCFMDGPLSLHSVKNYSSINGKKELIDKYPMKSRRRILRSHVKIHHVPFYQYYSNLLKSNITPDFYMRAMKFDPTLTDEELSFKNNILFRLYKDMVEKHSNLSNIKHTPIYNISLFDKVQKRFFGKQSDDRYLKAFINNIP